MEQYVNMMSCDLYNPTVPGCVRNQLLENNTYPHGAPLHNTVREVNLLPVCEDEVHLIVHTNAPHEDMKVIEWLCFGEDDRKSKRVLAHRC